MNSVWYCTSGEAQTMRHDITRDCFDYSKIKWLFDRPEGFSFDYGAIFIAHRDNIRKYSRAYWQRLFDSLQELLPGAGWGCDSSYWVNVIFTQENNYIFKFFINILI